MAAKAEVLSVAFNRNVPCLSSYYLPQFDMLDCDSSGALVYFSNTHQGRCLPLPPASPMRIIQAFPNTNAANVIAPDLRGMCDDVAGNKARNS